MPLLHRHVAINLITTSKSNVCVPHCHSTSKRHNRLSRHVLPRDEQLRKRWIVLIRNDNLRMNSNSILFVAAEGLTLKTPLLRGVRRNCSRMPMPLLYFSRMRMPLLYFQTPEWPSTINEYNDKMAEECLSKCPGHNLNSS